MATAAPAARNGAHAAPQPNPRTQLQQLFKASERQIAAALPRHLTAERMIRMAMTVYSRGSEQLQRCTPVSILAAVIQAAELGLELSGPLGQAYLVPYRNTRANCDEAQFQIGYRGLLTLAYRSGKVSNFSLQVVCEKDVFDYAYGTKPFIKHRPASGDRGAPSHAYAIMFLKGGASDFEVMSAAEIEQHRQRYSKARKDSPWNTAWDEMAKKTPARRLCKRAPVSSELLTASVLDEYGEAGIGQGLVERFDLGSLAAPPSSKADAVADILDAPPAGEESQLDDVADRFAQQIARASLDDLDAIHAELDRNEDGLPEPRIHALFDAISARQEALSDGK